MRVLVWFPGKGAEKWTAALAALLPEAEVASWTPDVPVADADYVAAFKPPPELFRRVRGLRAVFNLAAGVEAMLEVRTLDPALPLFRLEDAGMAEQMADYASYAVLRWFRQFDRYEEQDDRGEWVQLPPRYKRDFPVGVMGLGEIGGAVARRLVQLGFPVHGWSRSGRAPVGVTGHAGDAALDGFLSAVRVVVVTLPLTADTRGLLDRERLARLPRGAYLVNVGRGPLVVETDLLAAIESGHLAGAMLDVFDTEPLPPGHPYWMEPRIDVTPHVSAITLRHESLVQTADKIRRFHRGEPVSGRVDRGRGY
jgi:glyoxylate/hydroxypyruvate reductase A